MVGDHSDSLTAPPAPAPPPVPLVEAPVEGPAEEPVELLVKPAIEAPAELPAELAPRLVVVTVTEAAVVVLTVGLLAITAVVKAVGCRITHSGSDTRRDRGTERITPGDGGGGGSVVWSAVLIRAVVNAVVELRLRAETAIVAGAAAKSTGLGKHVGIACFLGDCQNHAASLACIARSSSLEPG